MNRKLTPSKEWDAFGGIQKSKIKIVHAYYYEENPIETVCGRQAFKVDIETGYLIDPPILHVTGDWFFVNCQKCCDILKIPPSYGLFREMYRKHD